MSDRRRKPRDPEDPWAPIREALRSTLAAPPAGPDLGGGQRGIDPRERREEQLRTAGRAAIVYHYACPLRNGRLRHILVRDGVWFRSEACETRRAASPGVS